MAFGLVEKDGVFATKTRFHWFSPRLCLCLSFSRLSRTCFISPGRLWSTRVTAAGSLFCTCIADFLTLGLYASGCANNALKQWRLIIRPADGAAGWPLCWLGENGQPWFCSCLPRFFVCKTGYGQPGRTAGRKMVRTAADAALGKQRAAAWTRRRADKKAAAPSNSAGETPGRWHQVLHLVVCGSTPHYILGRRYYLVPHCGLTHQLLLRHLHLIPLYLLSTPPYRVPATYRRTATVTTAWHWKNGMQTWARTENWLK